MRTSRTTWQDSVLCLFVTNLCFYLFLNILIPINEELKSICQQIINACKSLEEWTEIKSDDLFQTSLFEGGIDTTANILVFGYYGDEEYSFQLSLDQVRKIYNGDLFDLTWSIAKY